MRTSRMRRACESGRYGRGRLSLDAPPHDTPPCTGDDTIVMDSEEMDRLTEEERLWIQQKEEAVQEAGADVEGGTLYPLVTNEKAAELTREIVYELASLAGSPLDAQ